MQYLSEPLLKIVSNFTLIPKATQVFNHLGDDVIAKPHLWFQHFLDYTSVCWFKSLAKMPSAGVNLAEFWQSGHLTSPQLDRLKRGESYCELFPHLCRTNALTQQVLKKRERRKIMWGSNHCQQLTSFDVLVLPNVQSLTIQNWHYAGLLKNREKPALYQPLYARQYDEFQSEGHHRSWPRGLPSTLWGIFLFNVSNFCSYAL